MNHLLFNDITNNIHSAAIQDFVKACLKDVPEEFEKIPASTSGKYHPEKARGEGGLLWHVQRACWFGFKLIQANKWEKNDIKGDIVLAALILHDIGKKKDYKNYWEYVDHPKTAAKMIERHKGMLPEKVFKMIQGCVLHHMGPFGGKFFMKPMNQYNLLEVIVYMADYFASLKELEINR